MCSVDVTTLVGVEWKLVEPLVLTPCPLCGEPAGYVATDSGIAHRNGDGTPHVCKTTTEVLEGRYGRITHLVEAYRKAYHGAALVDLRLEQMGLYQEYEEAFWQAQTEEVDDVYHLQLWVLQAKMEAISAEINLLVQRHKLQERGVNYGPWRERVARVRKFSPERVLNALGVDVKGKMYCCPHHGDTNPSASIRGVQMVCYVCNSVDRVIDMVMKVKNVGFVDAVIWLEGNVHE